MESADENTIGVLVNEVGMWNISEAAADLYAARAYPSKFSRLRTPRHDPLLVQIFHELGDKFNDPYSKIEIDYIDRQYENYYRINGYGMIIINYEKYKYDLLISRIKSVIAADEFGSGSESGSDAKIEIIRDIIGKVELM